MIDVTGIDKMEFAKAVYRLSVPVGMGILHARTGELDDDTAKDIASRAEFHMDYVHGRGCKMFLSVRDGKLFAPASWYDHTDADYSDLLGQFGFSLAESPGHGCSCECNDCRPSKANRYPSWERGNAIPNN